MRNKTIILLLSLLCLFSSFAMFIMGENSVEWEIFTYLFWIPLPISVALLILARKMDSK